MYIRGMTRGINTKAPFEGHYAEPKQVIKKFRDKIHYIPNKLEVACSSNNAAQALWA
jgi:hypothetical protein